MPALHTQLCGAHRFPAGPPASCSVLTPVQSRFWPASKNVLQRLLADAEQHGLRLQFPASAELEKSWLLGSPVLFSCYSLDAEQNVGCFYERHRGWHSPFTCIMRGKSCFRVPPHKTRQPEAKILRQEDATEHILSCSCVGMSHSGRAKKLGTQQWREIPYSPFPQYIRIIFITEVQDLILPLRDFILSFFFPFPHQ